MTAAAPELKAAEFQGQMPAAEPASPSKRANLGKSVTRRESLKQHADQLALRAQILDAAEKSLRLAWPICARPKEDQPKRCQRAETERAGHKGIVTMYETMKPKNAARVFKSLALDVLVPIVFAMNRPRS